MRGSGTTSSGELSATDTYPQTSYVRWKTYQYLDCCFVASERVYKLIPASGTGLDGPNYDETDYGYDLMKRRYRTVTPNDTITDLVFEARGLVIGAWVGSKDEGATPTDPSGGGGPGNNMVLITSNVYDGGAAGGDGNLTQRTQWVDTTTSRVTNMTYDFRNRLITTAGEIDYFELLAYDNLDQVTMAKRYDTNTLKNLIGQVATQYDNQGRVYQTIRYAVDIVTGLVGKSLTDNTWYDASGNIVKVFPAGSQLFAKATYDSLGRVTAQYVAYGGDASYADAFSVANNTVLRQIETMYDADDNTIQVTVRERYHNAPATQLGALQTPGTTPNARVTYLAIYPDAISRPVNSANFGTNGGTALSRPATAPARADTVLVNSVTYDATGAISQKTDPAGMVVAFVRDAAGRAVTVTNNSGGSSVDSSCAASDDTNQVIQISYTMDGLQATLVAQNGRTTDQTTTFTFGTSVNEIGLPASDVASSLLLQYIDLPGSTDGPGGTNSIAFTYNRQGQRTSVKDQRGCVHQYVYDLLGRQTNDCVTTPGTDVDTAVLRLETTYDVRGLILELTSFNSAAPGSGSAVNDVVLTYNSFAQMITDTQSHSGLVVSGTTPQVQYDYADGSTNTIRPTTLTYPNGRAIAISYGTADGINDSASRVNNLSDKSGTLVDYAYLGVGTPVQTTYPLIGTQHTLLGSSSGNSPAGDIYWGLDQFSRLIDSRWFNTGANTDVDRIQYGYDRASNRIWRQNPVATAAGAQFDEFYTNDGLQRLKDMQRGTLNITNTGITAATFEQCWTLDPTGNWRGFNEAASGGSWTLSQSRTANTMNEITGITTTIGTAWATPVYDAAGNMTGIPQPASMNANYTGTYDAWNRLVKLVDATSGITVQQNQYDARNFRTVRVTPAISETRDFYYTKDWQCIEERVGTSTTADRQFVWGARYIDDLVLRDVGSERFYALQDANWNVTSIADTTGTIQQRYAYTPYGYPTFLTSSFSPTSGTTIGWEALYCGYRYDTGSGLFVVRNRIYQPLLGTWCQEDPFGYVSTPNLFGYVNSSPLNAIDPFGLFEEDLTAESKDAYLERAKKLLRAAVDAKQMTNAEAEYRFHIVNAALHARFRFGSKPRNPAYWTYSPREGAYKVKFGVRPSEAIDDAWKRQYQTGCLKSCQTTQLEGFALFCHHTDDEKGTSYRDKFDTMIGPNVPTKFIDEFVKVDVAEFYPPDFLPGDRIWVKNPFFERGKHPAGNEGSNAIAIGQSLFVSYTGETVYDIEGLQAGVRSFSGVPDAPLMSFTADERGAPIVPQWVQQP